MVKTQQLFVSILFFLMVINQALGLDPEPPVCIDDYAMANKGDTVIIDVLANDILLLGEPFSLNVSNPVYGTVTIQPNSFIAYTPDADLSGLTFDSVGYATDTFTYTITYTEYGITSEPATVTIGILNNLPIGVADTISTYKNKKVKIEIADLLSNDIDLDGDIISFCSFNYTGNGSLVDNGDGTLRYIPLKNFIGIDTFTYIITDSYNNAIPTSVTIIIDHHKNKSN